MNPSAAASTMLRPTTRGGASQPMTMSQTTRLAGRSGHRPRKRTLSPGAGMRIVKVTTRAATAGVSIITGSRTPANGSARPSPSHSGRATSQASPQASAT